MKKVLLFPTDGDSSLVIQRLKEQFGEDIEVITLEQAIEQKLTPNDFVNTLSYVIKMQPSLDLKEERTAKITTKDDYFVPFRVGKGVRAQNRTQKFNKFERNKYFS